MVGHGMCATHGARRRSDRHAKKYSEDEDRIILVYLTLHTVSSSPLVR
jgi:hypothetical protein